MLVVPHLSPPMMIRFGSCGVAFAAPPEAALAVGRVALAGARAHRLVGGVAGGGWGGHGCVSVSDTSGLV